MISDMRKHFQSPLYKGILWVGIVALAGVFSLPTLIKERSPNPWVIKVNDFEIGAKEFNWTLAEKREWLAMIRAQYGPQADFLLQAFGIKTDPVSLAMESVIKEGLIHDLARRMNLHLHTHSVQERLVDPGFIKYYLGNLVPQFALQADGSINPIILKNFLDRKGMRPHEFEKLVEQAIERKVVMDTFSVGAYIPFFDKNAVYSLDHSKRSFDIVTFSYEQQLKAEKQQGLSEEEIAAYYALKKGSTQYLIPEKRAGIVWKFDPSRYGITITKAEIERYYEDHKAQLYTKSPKKIEVRSLLIKNNQPDAQERVQRIYQELMEDPMLFADKARELSEDEDVASRSGRVESFARGEKEVAFERAAFLLKNDGDISSVIQTARGFEIIQRVKVLPPVYQEISQVYDSIQSTLLRSKFSNQFATDCKNIKIKFKKDKKDLELFVQEKNGVESAISFAPVEESIVSKTLFGIKTLESFDICIDKEFGYIIQLTGMSKAYTADLSEVKDAVKEDLYQSRAQENLKKKAQEALKTTSESPRLDVIKKTYGGSLVSINALSVEELSTNDILKGLSLESGTFTILDRVGLSRLVINDQGAHIIKITDMSTDDTRSQENALEELRRIDGQRKRVMSEAFVASLYRNATIKTNESMTNLQQNYSL
jgi:parvulin-like peptidyl-prolyl isomerase